jgi:hypothetical protein
VFLDPSPLNTSEAVPFHSRSIVSGGDLTSTVGRYKYVLQPAPSLLWPDTMRWGNHRYISAQPGCPSPCHSSRAPPGSNGSCSVAALPSPIKPRSHPSAFYLNSKNICFCCSHCSQRPHRSTLLTCRVFEPLPQPCPQRRWCSSLYSIVALHCHWRRSALPVQVSPRRPVSVRCNPLPLSLSFLLTTTS